jgi:hypothetical protein
MTIKILFMMTTIAVIKTKTILRMPSLYYFFMCNFLFLNIRFYGYIAADIYRIFSYLLYVKIIFHYFLCKVFKIKLVELLLSESSQEESFSTNSPQGIYILVLIFNLPQSCPYPVRRQHGLVRFVTLSKNKKVNVSTSLWVRASGTYP